MVTSIAYRCKMDGRVAIAVEKHNVCFAAVGMDPANIDDGCEVVMSNIPADKPERQVSRAELPRMTVHVSPRRCCALVIRERHQKDLSFLATTTLNHHTTITNLVILSGQDAPSSCSVHSLQQVYSNVIRIWHGYTAQSWSESPFQ